MPEETIYADQNVLVSTSRVVIGEITYALRNITSVKRTVTPTKRGWAIALIAVGLLGLAETFALEAKDRGFFYLVVALLVGTGVIWLLIEKTSYHVTIASSAGETHALTSKDGEYIGKIVGAINEAIIHS